MPVPSVNALRQRIPALAITALFHVAVVALFLFSLPKQYPLARREAETTITLLPVLPPPPVEKKKRFRRGAAGSNAITPYFNPYTFKGAPFLQPKMQGLQTALDACSPEKYDMASFEIRTVCDRIGALMRNDPWHFGVTQDVTDPKHWQRELARREAPYLAPCMSSQGFSPLYTLLCVYDVLMHGYDPEKQQRYSQ